MPIFISPSHADIKPAPTRWEQDREQLRRVGKAFIEDIDAARMLGYDDTATAEKKPRQLERLQYLYASKGALAEAFVEIGGFLLKINDSDKDRDLPATPESPDPEAVTVADIDLLRDYLQRQE